MRIKIDEINRIIACPVCKEPMTLIHGETAICSVCNSEYPFSRGTWTLIPNDFNKSSDLWNVWDQLQQNAMVSYTEDPEHNLGVGDREDCLAFSEFCRFTGLVLDVGCGPQPWPTYFRYHESSTKFIGVDPIIEEASKEFQQFRALGEDLPFRNNVFNHVCFATTMDHFIDIEHVLFEAGRVCKPTGEINIWIGEKQPDTPKPKVSFQWYKELIKPEDAYDVFHLKRLQIDEVERALDNNHYKVIENKTIRIDDYRLNYFIRALLRS